MTPDLTPDQLEAFKAAGGCEHTPNPYQACDTCGRPALPGQALKSVAYDWQARTVDGLFFTKRDLVSISNLPLDKVCDLIVLTDDPRAPRVTLKVDPTLGQRLHMFTRHCVSTGAKRSVSVPVFEIRYEGTEHRLRLYLHPVRGPILSPLDLWF